MNDKELRAFLNLMMCSDPWPTGDLKENDILVAFAHKESRKRGYLSWCIAYHEHMKLERYKVDADGFEVEQKDD